MNYSMKTSSGESLFDQVLSVIGVVVLLVASVLVHGWVLSVLWGWFVVPVFNVATITIAQAYGLSLVFSLFVASSNTKTKNEKGFDWAYVIVTSIFSPLVLLGIGWIIVRFV